MRPKRLARLIWLGAMFILVGDIIDLPWREFVAKLIPPDIDLIGLVSLLYTNVRFSIVTVGILAGISVMVRELDPQRRA